MTSKQTDIKYFPMPTGRNKKIVDFDINTLIRLTHLDNYHQGKLFYSYKDAYFEFCKLIKNLSKSSIAHHPPKGKTKGGGGRVKASGEGLFTPFTSIRFRRHKLDTAPHGGRLAAGWERRKSSTDASILYRAKHSERSRESSRGSGRRALQRPRPG